MVSSICMSHDRAQVAWWGRPLRSVKVGIIIVTAQTSAALHVTDIDHSAKAVHTRPKSQMAIVGNKSSWKLWFDVRLHRDAPFIRWTQGCPVCMLTTTRRCVIVKVGEPEKENRGKFILVVVSLQLLLTTSVADKFIVDCSFCSCSLLMLMG
jgi:hypothetical protein